MAYHNIINFIILTLKLEEHSQQGLALRMGITWEEAEVAAQNRSEWHSSVAQCIHLDVG